MKLGERGERLAATYLKKNGYHIVERNFKTSLGEIDIVAWDSDTLVFVEVKTRESIEYGMPFESVNTAKRRKISRVALLYLKKFEELPLCRFDVLSICYINSAPRFELIRDAFEV
jgi:putative endonuclease